MSLRSTFLIALTVLSCGGRAFALDSCRVSEFLEGANAPFSLHPSSRPLTYRPARVVGAPGTEVYLYDGGEGCAGTPCRRDEFLVPGNELVASHVTDGWACVFYVVPDMAKNGRVARQSVGWVAAQSLDIGEPIRSPTLQNWFGRWSYRTKWADENADIELRAGKVAGSLAATGYALGYGGNVPHTGSFEASASPKGNRILFKYKGGCQIHIILVGDWLVAGDNLKCGGLNVTFGGLYRRVSK